MTDCHIWTSGSSGCKDALKPSNIGTTNCTDMAYDLVRGSLKVLSTAIKPKRKCSLARFSKTQPPGRDMFDYFWNITIKLQYSR